jgi:hypothetical protein
MKTSIHHWSGASPSAIPLNRPDLRKVLVKEFGLLLTLSLLAGPIVLEAQTAASPSAAATVTGPTIRLNPFEVSEAVDDSFNTNTVGTGGRLVLDLKDVPAQYAVINRAFIDALGITDINEAAGWAAGQSFNEGNTLGDTDGQFGRFQQRGFTQLTTPNSTNSSGSSTGAQRNFYQNSAAGTQDAYAVESFDFGQGPNGILFGGAQSTGQFQASAQAAGLAGVQSTQTKKARLDRAQTTISMELGAFDYRRFTIDYNRPLTERIGIRINAVDKDAHGYVDHKEDQRRGLTITTSIRLTNNTDFSLDLSYDKSNVHNPTPMQENVSGWDGKTVGRGLIDTTMMPNIQNNNAASLSKAYGSILGTTTQVSFGGEPNGVTRFNGNANTYYWDLSTNTITNWRGMLVAVRAYTTSRTPLWTTTAPNGQFFVQGTRPQTNTSFGTTANPVVGNQDVGYGIASRSWLNMTGLPLDMYARAAANSKFYTMGIRENLNWEGPSQESRSKDMQFSLSHRVGNNLAVGLGGDWNTNFVNGRLMDRQVNQMRLDLNQVLPDGSPNPHFLQMFSASAGDGIGVQRSMATDKAIRANVQYTLNAGKWGSYVFNLNGNANTRRYDYGLYQVALVGAPNDPALKNQIKDPRSWVLNSPVRMQTYMGDPRAYRQPGDMAITLVNSQWVGTGTEGDTNAFTPTVTKSEARIATALNGFGPAPAVIQDFLTQNIAIQSTARWFDGKVVFLGGYRRDYNKTMTRQEVLPAFLPSADPIIRPAGYAKTGATRWDGFTRYWKPKFAGSMTDYYKLTYTPRDANGNKVGSPRLAATRPMTTITTGGVDGGNLNGTFQVMDPRYASDQFRDDWGVPDLVTNGNTKTYGVTYNVTKWLAPYINKSDQILPITLSSASTSTPPVDMLGNTLKDMVSRGTDFGTRFSFLNGKLSGKYNYFRTTRYNSPAGNGVITQINNLINSNRWDDIDTAAGATTAINQLGIVPLNGNGDYNTSSNYGYEWELSATVINGLRLTLNGGASSRATDNSTFYPLTRAYMADAANVKQFRALLEDAGGSLDTTQKPQSNGHGVAAAEGLAVLAPLPGKALGLDSTNAVNAYNNLWIQYDQLASNSTRTRSTPTMNFFADYRIQSGKLKGLQMGAGFQWQGPRSLGNRGSETIAVTDPVLGLVAIDDPTVDNTDIIWRTGALRTQANFSYTFRLRNASTLALALRVNNIGVEAVRWGLISRQPQGDLTKPNRVQVRAGNPTEINDPMNFRLTATYSFGGGDRR